MISIPRFDEILLIYCKTYHCFAPQDFTNPKIIFDSLLQIDCSFTVRCIKSFATTPACNLLPRWKSRALLPQIQGNRSSLVQWHKHGNNCHNKSSFRLSLSWPTFKCIYIPSTLPTLPNAQGCISYVFVFQLKVFLGFLPKTKLMVTDRMHPHQKGLSCLKVSKILAFLCEVWCHC